MKRPVTVQPQVNDQKRVAEKLTGSRTMPVTSGHVRIPTKPSVHRFWKRGGGVCDPHQAAILCTIPVSRI